VAHHILQELDIGLRGSRGSAALARLSAALAARTAPGTMRARLDAADVELVQRALHLLHRVDERPGAHDHLAPGPHAAASALARPWRPAAQTPQA